MSRTKKRPDLDDLSRRERQIMDIVFRMEQATAAEVRAQLPTPPSYSTARALLGILVKKGFLKREIRGPRYVYSPVHSQETARRGALKHLMQTFFNDSTEQVMSALLDIHESPLTAAEYERLAALIEKARKEGK